MDTKLKIVHFSDTHERHCQVKVPDGDVLVYSGDCSTIGTRNQIEQFFKWFNLHPHTYKIFIAGRSDKNFDRSKNDGEYPDWTKELLDDFTKHNLNFYLENNGCEIEGVKFWGSPNSSFVSDHVSEFWAFTDYKNNMNKYWTEIPENLDVLITYIPPYEMLDSPRFGTNLGCKYLQYHTKTKKPKVHLFGCIHESYGSEQDSDTLYLNSTSLNHIWQPVNSPQIFTIDCESKQVEYLREESKFKVA